ncbi:GNAT family N-acetyltransferase [Cetobacterium sp. 2A]|uniref:GNAT family N-acetyltransferase n=1 Tax=Cetobacterium sp. 2A TaxID=2754723 RepID=UPI00163C86E9|nr:GNAT family N-acetyltransferase [Cetobacterium sp. 2A]MBC2855175.1 GNAT family N-acetyltransferase [Cetobacterium sp. 2A]
MKVQCSKAQLIKPSVFYKDSFIKGYLEFQKEGMNIEAEIEYIDSHFLEFTNALTNFSKKKWYNPWFIPETIYWLVENEKFLGRVSIRHRLNKNYYNFKGHIGYAVIPSQRNKGHGNTILRLALIEAEKLGMTRVLVTCDSNNIFSKKIIENNGGVYENSKEDIDKTIKLRYWIEIKNVSNL